MTNENNEKDEISGKDKEIIGKIQKILKDNGGSDGSKIDKIYDVIVPQKENNHLSEYTIKKIKEMRSKGISFAKIGNRLNLPINTIRYHLGSKEVIRAGQARMRAKRKLNPKAKEKYNAYQREYQKKYQKDKREKQKEGVGA